MTKKDEPLGEIGGFMFDVDGTLILSDRSLGGYKALPGAAEVLKTFHKNGMPFVVLTNRRSSRRRSCVSSACRSRTIRC